MTFSEWMDEAFPEGGSGPGLVYTRDDMEEAFENGYSCGQAEATEYYARGGSFR